VTADGGGVMGGGACPGPSPAPIPELGGACCCCVPVELGEFCAVGVDGLGAAEAGCVVDVEGELDPCDGDVDPVEGFWLDGVC
jgi:hypothetical protein